VIDVQSDPEFLRARAKYANAKKLNRNVDAMRANMLRVKIKHVRKELAELEEELLQLKAEPEPEPEQLELDLSRN
jgi:chromosome segregation ATPase